MARAKRTKGKQPERAKPSARRSGTLLRVAVAAAALVVLALIVTLVLRRKPEQTAGPLSAFASPPQATADSIHFDDFVGSESCAGCHAAEHAAWSKSTHGRAGQAPPRHLLLRKFDGTPIRFRDAIVEPRTNGGQYEFV